MDQNVVGSDASLSRVGKLAEDHLVCSMVHVNFLVNDNRTFSTKLHDTWNHIFCCCLCHNLANCRAASEANQVKWLLVESDCNINTAFKDLINLGVKESVHKSSY
jgi:hypothetical protein